MQKDYSTLLCIWILPVSPRILCVLCQRLWLIWQLVVGKRGLDADPCTPDPAVGISSPLEAQHYTLALWCFPLQIWGETGDSFVNSHHSNDEHSWRYQSRREHFHSKQPILACFCSSSAVRSMSPAWEDYEVWCGVLFLSLLRCTQVFQACSPLT